ncbi:sensor histidine kinase [Fictibacillus fluitans]|uniref:histidine kinase n=1 Tax=Fictibacillus fluitans TaxID=3058422 RepID=A0ABT8HY53_9BACL|nr:sensor histidine kinase [Fictibacillus sp. NE201]MDN4525704.1 sensor histidine kinase [Fictibacillus sp. NE201]
MELWIIYTKLAVVIFLAVSYAHDNVDNLPNIVFCLLLYISLNSILYVFTKERIRQGILLGSVILIGLSFYDVNPLLILLLPINFYELASPFIKVKWVLLSLGLLPVLYLPEAEYLYGLVSALSFVLFTMAVSYSKKIMLYEDKLDKMRHDLQRLSASLNENQEFIKQSEYTNRLEERNRISQQIHDSIGHSMTGALIQMEAAKSLLGLDTEKAKELMQNAISISKQGIEDIRITLKNMKPPTEQMGVQRLKLILEEFSVKHRIKVPFVYKGNMDLITPIQWKIITENITEALTNALKYSRATEICIEIHVLNQMIKAEVKDDGKGAQKVVKGLGIMGMEERTASVNGTVIVDGTKGFSVTTLLPLG